MHWHLIAAEVGGDRKACQCNARWHNYLRPGVDLSPVTAAEDDARRPSCTRPASTRATGRSAGRIHSRCRPRMGAPRAPVAMQTPATCPQTAGCAAVAAMC
jgi:hypothetical protein